MSDEIYLHFEFRISFLNIFITNERQGLLFLISRFFWMLYISKITSLGKKLIGRETEKTSEPMPFLEIQNQPDGRESQKNPIHLYVQSTSDVVLKTYIGKLREHAMMSKNRAVGLDIEYNRPYKSGSEYQCPATIQLSCSDGFTIVFSLFHADKAPSKLNSNIQDFLYDPEVVFVGANVTSDITRLKTAYGVDPKHIQFRELAKTASDHGFELKSRQLCDMSRYFLKKQLYKGRDIRISNWTGKLTHTQINYAALDAFASVSIYDEILKTFSPKSSHHSLVPAPGVKVLMFFENGIDCIARGTIVEYNDVKWGRLSMTTQTSVRQVVKIDEIFISGASIPFPTLNGERLAIGKLDVGTDILWDVKYLREVTDASLVWLHQYQNPHLFVVNSQPQLADSSKFYSKSDSENFFGPDNFPVNVYGPFDETYTDEEEEEGGIASNTNVSSLMYYDGGEWKEFTDPNSPEADEVNIVGDEALISLDGERIHVRLDIFHAMYRLSRTMLQSHGAFRAFMSRLRDALFLVSEEDVEELKEYLKTVEKMTVEEIAQKMEDDWSFFLSYSRRAVPVKEILLQRFDRVCKAFETTLDNTTKEPLFRKQTIQAISNLRKHIELGCLSDVPDLALYFDMGKTSKGLPKRHCCRGTNSNEGNFNEI